MELKISDPREKRLSANENGKNLPLPFYPYKMLLKDMLQIEKIAKEDKSWEHFNKTTKT